MEPTATTPRSFPSDILDLSRYVLSYNPRVAECFRVACLYFLGTPIHRLFNFTPAAPPGCVRVVLYGQLPDVPDVVSSIDEADFRLEANGDLNLRFVRLWWGITAASPVAVSGVLFEPRDEDTLSALAVHTLSESNEGELMIEFWPNPEDTFALGEKRTWMHELQWRKRAFYADPAWYGNRLLFICVILWLLSLLPDAWQALLMSAQILLQVLLQGYTFARSQF